MNRRTRRHSVCKAILVGVFLSAIGLLVMGYGRAQAQDPRNECTGGTIPTSTHCTFMPMIATTVDLTAFDAIPVMSGPLDRPAAIHGDINLALRGFIPTTDTLALVDINGPTDANAPQLAGLFAPPRLPTFSSAHRVHEWDWGCDVNGCRSAPIITPTVTLLGLATTPGEPLFIPTRAPQIYGGGYKAMVLYAEAQRMTLVYTRDDTAAFGYVVHLEKLNVSPNLVALYAQMDAAGRSQLPALHEGERLGNAAGSELLVAIRDTGSFMEPRSRKDWWMGY
ncbi:MAG: hypothetical protein R3A44_41350 [Caldilineaceae bacterium]